MKISALLASTSILALSGMAHATTLGLSTDPMGSAWDRGSAGSAYGIWDAFTNVDFTPPTTGTLTFSNLQPGSSFGLGASGLSQSVAQTNNFSQGAGVYDFVGGMSGNTYGTDVFLNGGNNVTFTLNATLNFTSKGVVLQIKRAGSLATLADANGFTPMLTINSQTFGADGFSLTTGTGDTNSGAPGNYSVTTWFWGASLAGLTDTGASDITISMPKNSSFSRSIDTFAVDFGSAAPVPEPSTWITLAFGLGFLLLVNRHRFARR